MKSIFMECQCTSSEHTLKFIYDEEDKELYTTIYLCQYRNIFKRILVAIKYVLGYKSRYGAWDCFLFKSSDIEKLQKLLEKIKNGK
jgi:hypothetical protein